MAHRVYGAIVRAVRCGTLCEPFNAADFRKTYAGFGDGTYGAFLPKHAARNPGGSCADFAGSEEMKPEHLASGVQYRSLDRELWASEVGIRETNIKSVWFSAWYS